jgi:hypothetical protein
MQALRRSERIPAERLNRGLKPRRMMRKTTMREEQALTRYRQQLPGKPARISALRMSRSECPGRMKSVSRSTTLVSAIPVRCDPLTPPYERLPFASRDNDLRAMRPSTPSTFTNSSRCLHTLRQGPRGCLPHRSRTRGRRYRRVGR